MIYPMNELSVTILHSLFPSGFTGDLSLAYKLKPIFGFKKISLYVSKQQNARSYRCRPCPFYHFHFFLFLGSKSVSDKTTIERVMHINVPVLQCLELKNVSCVFFAKNLNIHKMKESDLQI